MQRAEKNRGSPKQSRQGLNFIAAIAVEGDQNAVDHCGNDGNFLWYSVIFILFTVHYYFADT
jgi:hypothetical protein